MSGRDLLRWALLALAAWSLVHLIHDGYWHARACVAPAALASSPDAWRVGSPTWDDFATTVARVAAVVPAGATIAWRAPPERWMLAWYAAYLLPDHTVLPVSRAPRLETARYAVALERPWREPSLEPIVAIDGLWIYRRRP